MKNEDQKATPSAERIAAEQIEDRVAALDATIFRSIAQRYQASIAAGRAFNELKEIIGHGKWQPHFEEKFASKITLRTAERWMKRAKKEDAAQKRQVSILKPASDEDAQERREATKEALAEMEAAVSAPKRVQKDLRHVYKLPLRMTAEERQAAEALQTLPDWPRAEKEILSLLRGIFMKYGIIKKDGRRHR